MAATQERPIVRPGGPVYSSLYCAVKCAAEELGWQPGQSQLAAVADVLAEKLVDESSRAMTRGKRRTARKSRK